MTALTLFTDGAQFTRDVMNDTHNTHSWFPVNPPETTASNLRKFSVIQMCAAD